MSKTIPFPQVLTANRLSDGLAVYWVDPGRWTGDVAEATVLGDAGALAAALSVAQATATGADGKPQVVEIYGISVETPPGATGHLAPMPVRLRERIRALGPTVGLTLNRSRFSPDAHRAPVPRTQAE